ncbi:MAG: glycosyltransferase family 39 protein [Candidatus Bathyarchaeota archaeon]|nr:glycosyltransferase family 39 protein [Candidatus Bathyarchaeota archaeon]
MRRNLSIRTARRIAATVGIFILSLAIRLYFIDETSIMPDEPIYVEAGRMYVEGFRKLDFSYDVWRFNAEHPPVAKLLIGLTQLSFHGILGGDIHALYLSARIAPAIVGSLIPLSIYILGSSIYGEITCFITGLTVALSPWMVYHSTLATLDIFASFFTTLSFLTLYYVKPDNRMHIPLGIFSGLAIGSKGTAIICLTGILIYCVLIYIFEEERKYIGRLFVKLAISIAISILTFIAVWPWLWPDPLRRGLWVLEFHASHMARGHTTFYAGNVYTHVPPWIPVYVISVKNPIATILSIILYVGYAVEALLKRKRSRGDLLTISWLSGGITTYALFPIIIGDHYILPLASAVYLSSIYVAVTMAKDEGTIRRFLGFFLVISTIASLGFGLYRYRESPGAYVSEIIVRGVEAIIMAVTVYEDTADYMAGILPRDRIIVVATPYSPSILEIDLRRKGLEGVVAVGMDSIDYADYVSIPILYARRYGIPKVVLDRFRLIYTVTSGNTMLTYIFEANKTTES